MSKIVLITGASSGMGLATSKNFKKILKSSTKMSLFNITSGKSLIF